MIVFSRKWRVRIIYDVFYAYLIILFTLNRLFLSPGYAEEVSRESYIDTLKKCCFNDDLLKEDGGLLLQHEPVVFRLVDFVGLSSSDTELIEQFIVKLKDRSDVALVPMDMEAPIDIRHIGSIVAIVPWDKSELDQSRFGEVQKSLATMGDHFHTRPGFDAKKMYFEAFEKLFNWIYEGDSSKFGTIFLKNDNNLLGAFTIVRSYPGNIALPETIERGILHSLTYNKASAKINGSVFSELKIEDPVPAPTELDFYVLKKLYQDKTRHKLTEIPQ